MAALDEIAITNQINQQKNTKRNELAKAETFSPVDAMLSRQASTVSPQTEESNEETEPSYGNIAIGQQYSEESDDYSGDEETEDDQEEFSPPPRINRDSLPGANDGKGQAEAINEAKNQAANAAKLASQAVKTEQQVAKAAKLAKSARYVWVVITFLVTTWWVWLIALIILIMILTLAPVFSAFENCGWTFSVTSFVNFITGDFDKILTNAIDCQLDNPEGPPTPAAESSNKSTPKPSGSTATENTNKPAQ